jgi:nucleoside-diphosphate-sugar epimerase
MRIAVLGANGRVANAVARAFLAHGHAVIAITRSGKATGLAGNVEFRAADAGSESQLTEAMAGADLIFNGLNPPYDQWAKKAMPMARAVMAAARAHHIPHLFIGNVYNFGHGIPVGANEATVQNAETRKGKIRIEMERLFEDEARIHGVKTIILRAGDFYGSGAAGSWFDLFLVAKVAKGRFTWPGDRHIPHAFAYLPDLAEAFVALAERIGDLPVFDTFTFAGHTLSGAEFKTHVETAVGRSLKDGSVPWWLFRLIGPFYPLIREVNEMSYLWDTPHSLDGKKLADIVGSLPSTTPAAAIRQALIDQRIAVKAG